MSFSELGLIEPILRALDSEGYENATPIQAQAIPAVLASRDVLGCAQTGTGKTGAFSMPILHLLSAKAPEGRRGRAPGGRRPRALMLCPTRELAAQITDSLDRYGRHLPLRHLAIFGGVRQTGQIRQLKAGVDILVATPGRLLDLMNQGYVDLSAVRALVLDEADRMLDMGFINDIRRITKAVPAERQTLLFSATMPKEIRSLADALLQDPVRVQVTPAASTVDTIAQSVYHVPKPDKPGLLTELVDDHAIERALVFSRTKHGADKIVRTLRRSGVEADAIHGNKSQNARTRALDGFKSGRTRVLVATDIASRGIDVDGVTHVINYDLPPDAETYVHRIGRTARAGNSGVAISFCDETERAYLRVIERVTKKRLDRAKGGSRPAGAPGRERAERSEPTTDRVPDRAPERTTKRAPGQSTGRAAVTEAETTERTPRQAKARPGKKPRNEPGSRPESKTGTKTGSKAGSKRKPKAAASQKSEPNAGSGAKAAKKARRKPAKKAGPKRAPSGARSDQVSKASGKPGPKRQRRRPGKPAMSRA